MEEIPSKHDNNNKNKKKNTKILPVAINIGVGGLGIGGIVFLGGALVAATIVSALAFKTRRQRRRSSSGNMNKSMSSTDTHSLDAPSDEVTSMEEIKTKNIQSSTPIEEDSCLDREDGGSEEQKDLMLINNENDEHVDANSLVSDEGGMSIEEYVAIEDEDHEETLFKNEATTCMNKVKVEDNLHDEIVLENCEGDLSDETGYGDHIVHEVIMERENQKEEETSRSTNKEVKDAETTQKVEEQVIIADEAAKVVDQTASSPRKLMSKDEKDEIPLVESVKEEQESEEDVIVKVQLRSGVSSFSVQEEPTPEAKISNHKTEETYVQVKVEMTADHELVKKDEIPEVEYSKEDEGKDENVIAKVELSFGVTSFSSQEELTPEIKIISHKIAETNVQVIADMITDHELVKKDEFQHVESTKEDDMEEDVAIKDVMVKVELSSGVASSSMQEEPSPESKITNHKIKETIVETITDHKLVKKDEIPHVESVKEDEDNVKDVTVKVELGSCVRSFSMQKEPTTPKEKISNKIEETDAQVKLEMIIDHELVKKDETLHVESIKGDKDSEEDVAVKGELGYGVNSSMHEEPTPKAKINNHKIEENMKEDQTFLGKIHNDSDDNEVIKEQAFASKPWNLKLVAWFVFISLCCLLGSLLLILILLGYHNHATNFVI